MERKKKYYQKITRNLLTAFFVCSVLPIMGFALIMKETVEQTNIRNLGELAEATVTHRGEVISQFLQEKVDTLNTLVGLYPEEYMREKANVEHLFLILKPRGDFVDLQVIDATGKQHAYVGPYREKIAGKSYEQAPWFTETLISGVHISDLFAGYRDVPHFVVAVTNPLKSYVLRATINSSMFNALLHSAQLGPAGDVYIVNRSGLFQTPSLQGDTMLDQNVRTLLSADNKDPLVTDSDIYTSHWMADNRWLLILKASISDSLGYYLKVRDRIILAMILISALAMLGAIAASMALSRMLQSADREYATLHLQFAQVEKMAAVGRLAAGIAHEINNPLQMITSQAGWIGELLEEEDPKQVKNMEEYTKSVEQIRHHVRRAGTITHRLLGFSRKISAQNEQVRLADLLEETISFVEQEAGYHNIVIKRQLASELPELLTDGPQLQQVVLNRLNNAIDAVGQDGKVTVRTGLTDDGRIRLEVADTGTGIKPEHLKQLFDPFFTTKDAGKGTGLGLSISYDIIRRLGGTIEAKNSKEGAVFTIMLPVRAYGPTA